MWTMHILVKIQSANIINKANKCLEMSKWQKGGHEPQKTK